MKKGFTLIELMIGLCVVCIVVGLAVGLIRETRMLLTAREKSDVYDTTRGTDARDRGFGDLGRKLGVEHTTITIDGCEYLVITSRANSGFTVVHKGNCRNRNGH